MKALISWSGSRELLITNAIEKWLEAVVPEVDSFKSTELKKGERWFDGLAGELEDTDVVFMCLAPPRDASEWQLFEAGAVWKAAKRDGLFVLCFGVRGSDVAKPLQAFQVTQFDKEDFERLAKLLWNGHTQIPSGRRNISVPSDGHGQN